MSKTEGLGKRIERAILKALGKVDVTRCHLKGCIYYRCMTDDCCYEEKDTNKNFNRLCLGEDRHDF